MVWRCLLVDKWKEIIKDKMRLHSVVDKKVDPIRKKYPGNYIFGAFEKYLGTSSKICN